MITFQEHTGNIKVEEYSLAAWLAEVETVINQGYKFDFESNEGYPTGFGSMYTAVLVPAVAKTEVLVGKKETADATTDVSLGVTFEDTPVEPVVETPVQPVQPAQTSQTKRKNTKG